jgi:cytochrome c biogenesis protein CcmG/thiol:disulfide interchange protein DsbE
MLRPRPRLSVPAILGALAVLSGCSESRGPSEVRAEEPATGAAVTPGATSARGATPAASGSGGDKPAFPPAPGFTLSNVAGGSLSLADLRGKVVLLDFWATWCGPCRAGIPHLNDLYRKHREAGLEIVGISVDRGRGARSGLEMVREFTGGTPITYPLVMADAAVVAAYGGIRSIPTAFLVDRNGNVRKRYVGLQPKEVLERDVAPLLAETASGSEGTI